MKLNILNILPCFFLFVQFTLSEYYYGINYVNVPVDHFSFTNNATFKLRYLVNDSFWNSDGPIFFYTGNEGDINLFAQNTGFIWEIAASFRALVIFAEHRYYGESLPFGDKSFTEPKYIGYLHSSQALADFVYLIEHIEKSNEFFTDVYRNPVIAFGGSYGGMLSAWLRMKYPASVVGAVASSAPILQFQTPCDVYNRIVTSVFQISADNDCPDVIKRSWPALRTITSTASGREWLTKTWKLCEPLEQADIPVLFSSLVEIYSNMAMVNYPYPTNFIANLPGYPIKEFCDRLSVNGTTPNSMIEALGVALTVYTNYTEDAVCFNISTQSTDSLGTKGWDFQSCTEMIMPMCSTKHDMFEEEQWNYTKFSEECYQRWKVHVTQPNLAVLEYGGKNLQAASNIIFTNGLMDPWSGGGVLYNVSRSVLTLIMPDTAHHLDFRAHNSKDPYSVIQTRNQIQRVLRKWLKTYYRDVLNMYYE